MVMLMTPTDTSKFLRRRILSVMESAGADRDVPIPMPGTRRGRPPATSSRELQQIALRLFVASGFENTTIEQITAEAGVSERTFFRYFASKASVLWTEFETEVETIRTSLTSVPEDVPLMDAIRRAVVTA